MDRVRDTCVYGRAAFMSFKPQRDTTGEMYGELFVSGSVVEACSVDSTADDGVCLHRDL
jgi:hypothetical protein